MSGRAAPPILTDEDEEILDRVWDEIEDDEPDTKRADALRAWETKALNRLRRGRDACVTFETDDLDVLTRGGVEAGLRGAGTAQEVRRVFREAGCE